MSSDLAVIRKVCGDKIADALAREFSGTRVYVPKHLNATTNAGAKSPLISIGRAHAEALSRQFGGSLLYVPRNVQGAKQRRATIVALAEGGEPTRSIARHIGCSERLVQLAKRAAT